ncbi:MAG TPA: Gfo/Idh/MocA family oxidoreductase [Chloroflexia bacterium]|nr:Gfo/Idh/MocA family oxidoreductase [Chloroflexia bacterium]
MSTGSRALRAAVIGAGAMGRNHCRVYHELPGVDLVGVADADPATAERAGHSFHVPHFPSPAAVLAATRPDLVTVAVPTMGHLPVALEAIAGGAHVLVEKPLAFTVEEGRQIIAAAAAAGRILAVGHVERYNPALTELQGRLGAGALGRVFQMHAQRLGPFPARVRDVGVVVDLATHDVDIMRYLSGAEVTRISAETARRIHTDHEDLLSGLLRFSDGTIGVLDINWLTPTKIRQLTVTGEGGMFHVNYLTQDLYFYENDYASSPWDTLSNIAGVNEGNMMRLRLDRAEPLRRELEAFVAAVRGESRNIVSGEDGLKAVEITQQIVTAGLTGETVHLVESAAR